MWLVLGSGKRGPDPAFPYFFQRYPEHRFLSQSRIRTQIFPLPQPEGFPNLALYSGQIPDPWNNRGDPVVFVYIV